MAGCLVQQKSGRCAAGVDVMAWKIKGTTDCVQIYRFHLYPDTLHPHISEAACVCEKVKNGGKIGKSVD